MNKQNIDTQGNGPHTRRATLPATKQASKKSPQIKVIHLVAGSLEGGAARGALALHKGLLLNGVDSTVITDQSGASQTATVISLPETKFDRFLAFLNRGLEPLVFKLYPRRDRHTFSTGLFGLRYKANRHFQQATIVHLHWINGLVTSRSIGNLKKPVVWSIRDMWPMTGGCHYSMGCERYVLGCGACPQLNGCMGVDFTRWSTRRKKRLFKNVLPIGISEWVTSELQKSFIFRDATSLTIPNCIDASAFYPIPKLAARLACEIATEKKSSYAARNPTTHFIKGFPSS